MYNKANGSPRKSYAMSLTTGSVIMKTGLLESGKFTDEINTFFILDYKCVVGTHKVFPKEKTIIRKI